MVISSQEGISSGVKGHMEEAHGLGLLSCTDHRHQHTEEARAGTLSGMKEQKQHI